MYKVIGIVVLSFLVTGIMEFAWQEVSVAAFGAPPLTFWQTYGLMAMVGFVGSCFKDYGGK